jgi:hypothetical protein
LRGAAAPAGAAAGFAGMRGFVVGRHIPSHPPSAAVAAAATRVRRRAAVAAAATRARRRRAIRTQSPAAAHGGRAARRAVAAPLDAPPVRVAAALDATRAQLHAAQTTLADARMRGACV